MVYVFSRMQASIFKAICSAFPDGTEPESCSQFGYGECSAGRIGSFACSNADSVITHRTRCVEKFMDFECACTEGYQESGDGVTSLCVDINECEQSNVCSLRGPRSVCVNMPGSYRCVLI